MADGDDDDDDDDDDSSSSSSSSWNISGKLLFSILPFTIPSSKSDTSYVYSE